MMIKVSCYSEHRECLDRECYGPTDLQVLGLIYRVILHLTKLMSIVLIIRSPVLA